jgi:hypothetical protein
MKNKYLGFFIGLIISNIYIDYDNQKQWRKKMAELDNNHQQWKKQFTESNKKLQISR